MNKNVRTVNQNGVRFQNHSVYTMSAYFRTAVCLVVAGIFSIEALGTAGATFSGWLLLVAGMAAFLFGVKHHNESRRVRQPVVSNSYSRRFSR